MDIETKGREEWGQEVRSYGEYIHEDMRRRKMARGHKDYSRKFPCSNLLHDNFPFKNSSAYLTSRKNGEYSK